MALLVALAATLAQSQLDDRASERNSEIMNKIKSMSIDVDWNDTSFDEAVQYLREYTNVNIYLGSGAIEKKDSKINLKVKGVRVYTVMKLLLSQLELGAMIKGGVLEITTKDKLYFNVVTRVYDVRDLFVKINNFPGPRLELIAPTGAGGGGNAPGVTFSLEEPVEARINVDFVTELIREMCSPKSWEENANASIQLAPNGLMIVSQSKSVHAEVENLVNMLRELK